MPDPATNLPQALGISRAERQAFDVNAAGSYPLRVGNWPITRDELSSVIGAVPYWGTPVADIAALKAVTAAARVDKQARVVESDVNGKRTIYVFEDTSTATDDGDTVVAPTAGTGRWFKAYELSIGDVVAVNKTGAPIAKGTYVAYGPYNAAAGHVTVVAADPTNPQLAPVSQLEAALADGATIVLHKEGIVTSILDTSGSAVGNPVYVGAGGAPSLTDPGGQNMGWIGGSVVSVANPGHIAYNAQWSAFMNGNTAMRAGFLSADATGRALMQDGFFDLATFAAKVADGAVESDKLAEDIDAISGEALAQYDLLYVSDYDQATTKPILSKANADTAAKAAKWIHTDVGIGGGVAFKAYKKCRISLDTSGFTAAEGDPLYLASSSGLYTDTVVSNVNYQLQQVGVLTKKDAAGIIDLNLHDSKPTKVGLQALQFYPVRDVGSAGHGHLRWDVGGAGNTTSGDTVVIGAGPSAETYTFVDGAPATDYEIQPGGAAGPWASGVAIPALATCINDHSALVKAVRSNDMLLLLAQITGTGGNYVLDPTFAVNQVQASGAAAPGAAGAMVGGADPAIKQIAFVRHTVTQEDVDAWAAGEQVSVAGFPVATAPTIQNVQGFQATAEKIADAGVEVEMVAVGSAGYALVITDPLANYADTDVIVVQVGV